MDGTALEEVDQVEITVLVDNELDPISGSHHPDVHCAGPMQGIPLTPIQKATPTERGDARLELRMDSICCAAHGLSLLITAKKGDKSHSLLFDAGPEGEVWERNVKRLRADVSVVEHIHLSHWHRDHSGGLERAISLIKSRKNDEPVVVDLHPERPGFRGIQIPGIPPISFEADPSFDELAAAGATVVENGSAHTVLEDFFLVSGEIPRQTSYEEGIRGAVRYVSSSGKWESDPLIMDERLVKCNLKGKGLVVFTGCSHAGLVNVCRHALDLGNKTPLHAVVGGFHLADADSAKLQQTVQDLKALDPTVIMPGHCTGWRFKFEFEKASIGTVVPCFVGTKYLLKDDITEEQSQG